MKRNHRGSLGYQMMKILQGVFQPGSSQHNAKRYRREVSMIASISTMRCMSADVHQFARFIRVRWPEVRRPADVRPDMAQAYIETLKQRGRSGGRIGRVYASIRKLDTACRTAGICPTDAPLLLPHKKSGEPGGHHSKPKPIPYSPEQAQAIIDLVMMQDPSLGNLLTLMWKTGLRITEACYLRSQDVDLEQGVIHLNKTDNANRTKGGRPRQVHYPPDCHDFLVGLVRSPETQPSGHLFAGRRGLANRARRLVRKACLELDFPCLADS